QLPQPPPMSGAAFPWRVGCDLSGILLSTSFHIFARPDKTSTNAVGGPCMLDLVLTVPQDPRPGYLRIAEALRSAIQGGQAKPGERLPSSRTLAVMLGVHRHT